MMTSVIAIPHYAARPGGGQTRIRERVRAADLVDCDVLDVHSDMRRLGIRIIEFEASDPGGAV